MPASTGCALYESHGQVALFFEWIKQHLRIKRFYGTSANAAKTQTQAAAATRLPAAIVKKRLNPNASLCTSLQILSVTAFTQMPCQQVFQGHDYNPRADHRCNQPNPFAPQPGTSELSL